MLLRSGTHDTSMTFDADVLADGKYYFRVTASDREANPPASAREAELISTPVTIDNTPPAITMGTVRYAGGAAHVEWESADAIPLCAAANIRSTPAIGCPWKPWTA
jgi:hypothetical protein